MYESTDFSEFLPFCQEAMTEGWRALSFRNVLEVVGVTPLGVMIMYLSMSLLALLRCTLHTHTHTQISLVLIMYLSMSLLALFRYANYCRSVLRLNWPFALL
jgi:hypothetical protein